MTPRAGGTVSRIRVVAALVIVALVAGPAASHIYWMLGGTWGLGPEGTYSPTGVRVVAAIVVVLVALAMLVVLARVGFWRQGFVSERVIRVLAWALAGFFLVHALVSFAEGWAGSLDEWWLYGPGGLVIGLLALVVAGSRGAWRLHRPHRMLPSQRRLEARK